MTTRFLRTFVLLGLLAILISGCGRLPEISRGNDESASQISAPTICTDMFMPHPLDFTTTVRSQPVRMFDSNGAGVAVDDLDGDGDQDIVLANLGGPNAVLWNLGDLAFHRQDFPYGDSRAAAIVDVDGDGWRDVVFTNRLGAPMWWRNTGNQNSDISEEVGVLQQSFVQQTLPGVMVPAYAMAWGDLDQDGDLDLVTGSYDAELEQVLRDSFMFGGGAGVYTYENRDGVFVAQRLADKAQALTIALFDVNDDGWLDIVVGNDFGVQDSVWLHSADGWQPAQPFAATTHSTMSFAAADIDNDGQEDLFATDMKPYAEDPQTLAQWQPVMDGMHHVMLPGDPQIMENVLQVRQKDGSFANQAAAWGVDATGWSWSSQFGDLDNDGWLDLYVVNGMAAEELFGHLPGNELVEANQAFRNEGDRFVAAPQWGLDATAGGRGMALADLDNDGDLDVVVNNLLAPAMVYENQICAGAALEVDLRWPGSGNTHALGAVLTLTTDDAILTRMVRAGSGYASGNPGRIHFGFPVGARLERLDIRWPDGAVSSVDALEPGALLTVTRR
ncbi:MAG TPA: CRTAC1 family protein [Anaerolineae bacterium]|nr:CRTAC1 family protein [Anaerolineae bacterium]